MTNDGRHNTADAPGGRRTSSAVPRGTPRTRVHGLKLQAVVIATYTPIDGLAFDAPMAFPQGISAVYCDLVAISSMEGFKGAALRRVIVAQDAGLHCGEPWIPRAATQTLSGTPLDPKAFDPMDCDGDHVIVEFLDDDMSKPYVSRRFVHPHVGHGNEGLSRVGHRMKLKNADGEVWFRKQHGSYLGIDANGNIELDTTRAGDREIAETGEEVPKNDADHGKVTVRVNSANEFIIVGTDKNDANEKFKVTVKDNSVVIRLVNGATFELDGKAGTARMRLGDATHSAAVAEPVEVLWGEQLAAINAWFTALGTLLTALNADLLLGSPPPGAAVAAQLPATVLALPTYFAALLAPPITGAPAKPWVSATMNSTRVKIPDNVP
jgi:hypothetical protein